MEITLQNIHSSFFDLLTTLRRARIKSHLRRVESSLRKNIPSSLTREQLQARRKTLDNLNSYWQAGDFPVNDTSEHTTPIFKDIYGNYCAVGYLLSKVGFDTYVSEIQAQNNYILVKEITDKKYLHAITSLGITKEEAARIQPGYGFEDPFIYGGGSGNTVSILKLVSVVLFVLLQLIAYFFFKEMNMSKKQKFLGFLTLFLTSSLILAGIWSLLLLVTT